MSRMPCSITDGGRHEAPDLEDADTGYDRLRQQEVDDRRHDMESIPALHIRKSELGRRNDEGRSRWLRLRRAALAGHVLTDPRNQEQRDLGIELVWRLRVARHYIEIMEGDVVIQRLTPDFAVDCDARNLDAGHTRKMTKSELAREFGEDNEK